MPTDTALAGFARARHGGARHGKERARSLDRVRGPGGESLRGPAVLDPRPLRRGGKRINHGGAARVRFKHRHYGRLVQRLFVSVLPVHCDVKSNQSGDLRLMGVELEYICLARYAQRFNRLPEFNDKRRSPKHGSRRRTTRQLTLAGMDGPEAA